MSTDRFYIASLKHTHKHHEHIVFWGKNHCGYTPVVGDYIGEYSRDEASKLNDGVDCLAVPVDVVKFMLMPEPYYAPEKRFYDQRGPVAPNTREVWDAMHACALAKPSQRPKPEVFRGKRRSFTWTPKATGEKA